MEEKFGMLALDSDNNFGVHFHPITSELTCFSLRTLRVLARLSLSSETTAKFNTQPVIFRDSQSSKPCVVLCLTPNLVRFFALPTLKVLRELTLQDIDGDSKVLCMRIDNFVSRDEELAFFMVDEKQKLRYVSPSNTIEFESRLSADMLFDFNANTLCAVAEGNCVHFFDLDLEDNVSKLGFGPRHRLPSDKPIVLLRCHPESSEVVAVADVIGRILLCRLGSNGSVFHSVLHWHSSPVSALAFSAEGADLVSGGAEAVLLKWNVQQARPHEFAPRLGAQVVDVQVQSKSNHCYALLKDDALVKLNEAFFVSGRNFVGSQLRTAQKAKLWWHVATSTLAFVNASGFVHFFSPNSHETAFILEIDDTNAIRGGAIGRKQDIKNDEKDSKKEEDDKKEDTDALVSPVMALGEERGDWLVSVADKDIRLWRLALDQECKFIMHSCIIQPHTQHITMLRLIEHYKEPTQCLLISSSLDKSIKIWMYTEDSSWQFLTTLTFRYKVANCLDYSRDRSLLAVGYEEVVALFSLNKFALKSTLAKRDFNENVESLAFNRDKQNQHQLITTTKNKIMIWDVLRSQLMMSMDDNNCSVSPVGPDLVLITDCKSGEVRSIKQLVENKKEFVVNVGSVDDQNEENWLSLISDLDKNVYWSRGQYVEWGGRLDLAPVEEVEENRKPNKLFPNLTYIENLQDQQRLQHLRDVKLRDIKLTRPLMASLDRVLEQVL